MTAEKSEPEREYKRTQVTHQGGTSEALYGLGVIGAWIYFVGQASSFWIGVLGVLKGAVWPAILVYEVFKYLSL